MNAFGASDDELSQMREVVDLFNTITDRCFQDCVVSTSRGVACVGADKKQFNFRTKKLATEERSCIVSCSDKWIGATQRITRTFVEQQWAQGQEKAQQAAAAAQHK